MKREPKNPEASNRLRFFCHRCFMKFYHIKDDYIDYLRTYDSKVAYNKCGKRPYVGTVLEIYGVKYYAPFTSPKSKHQKMKNGKDFRKIQQGKYGAINFNNMIPVVDSALDLIDIEHESDPKYKNLLQNQYAAIIRDEAGIKRTAITLHTLVMTEDSKLSTFDQRIKARCCNLKLLESIYAAFNAK